MKILQDYIKNLLFEIKDIDAKLDLADDEVFMVLQGILSDLEQEAVNQESERIDEVGVAFVAGAALAMPIIMKGIVGVSSVFRKALSGYGIVDSDPGWENWLNNKSDELHHAYIHICEKIVDGAIKVAETASLGKYQGPSEVARKRAANVLFVAILATLAGSAGVGIGNALAGKSYMVAGTESLLGAIKVGEIQAIAGELLVDILGFGAVESVTAIGGVAAGVGLS